MKVDILSKNSKHKKLSNVLIEVTLNFQTSLSVEIASLLEASKGDNPDRFGHIKYWKCMLALIPVLLKKDVSMSDINVIAKEIGFSRDQVVRSLNRFVRKNVLIKSGSGSYTTWKLNKEVFPTLYFLCREKKLTHIVRHWLTLNAVENISR